VSFPPSDFETVRASVAQRVAQIGGVELFHRVVERHAGLLLLADPF